MPLEDILNKIIEGANSAAKDIENKAVLEAEEIIKEAKKEALQIKHQIIEQETQQLSNISQKEIVAARLKMQNRILQERRTCVDAAFDEAKEYLVNLADDLYCQLIKDILVAVGSVGKADIIFSSDDKSRISPEFINRINPDLRVSFSQELRAGFILKTKEVILDNSFEKILASMCQDCEPEVANILAKAEWKT